jgi:hypothetical protein
LGETYNLNDVEVFALGTWNGDRYTVQDIEDLVKNTNELLEKVKPYAKLGHDDNQSLLQADGYPSAGWITKLKRQGNKVLADFSDVPKVIYQLIKNKAYKRVSSEIFWNFKDTETDKVYSRVLKAVAFLGGDTPAVTTLKDIAALYGRRDQDIKVVSFSENDHDVRMVSFSIDEPKPKKGGKETMEIEYQGKKYTQDEFQALLDRAKKADDAESQLKEYTRQQQQKDIESFITTQKEKGRVLPAHEGLVKTLMQAVQENQVVRYSDKEVAPLELFKQYIEGLPELVKLSEVSAGAGGKEKKEDKFEDAVQKYSDENKVSYTQAVKAVARQEPALFEDYQKRMRGEA